MIPTSAVKSYLSRTLDDHLWVKRLSEAQLDTALSSLNPRPNLSPELKVHQRACFLLGVAYPQFSFWLDMGTGKSLLSLELLRYWWQAGLIKRALVFVTSDKAFSTWEGQAKRFNIKMPIIALEGSSKDRWARLEEFQEGIALIPYPGAVAMVSRPVKAKKGTKWKLDEKLVKKLSNWTDAFVLDESTKIGNKDSLSHQLVARLGKKSNYRYALAGRPFGRDPTMLWAQQNLIDDGETLGETLGLFRAAFFNEQDNYWGGPYSKKYTFKAKMKPVLAEMMRHRSITYAAEECIDLPAVVPITEMVHLQEEATAYYQRLIAELRSVKGNIKAVENVFLRMRQISSGFLGVKDEEDGTRAEIEFEDNPKLDRLLELIEEVPEGNGTVIFYAFTRSGRKIVEELRKLKYDPIWLWSGTKDPRAELARFAKSKQPIAVVQVQIGSMSIDGLQHSANYLMFFENCVGSIDRAQAEARLVRQGQPKKVFVYDLVVAKTVDERILQFQQEGQGLFEALMRDPEKALL